jgi:hypothetical protein
MLGVAINMPIADVRDGMSVSVHEFRYLMFECLNKLENMKDKEQ